MRIALELLRIIVIFGLLGALGWVVIENFHTVFIQSMRRLNLMRGLED